MIVLWPILYPNMKAEFVLYAFVHENSREHCSSTWDRLENKVRSTRTAVIPEGSGTTQCLRRMFSPGAAHGASGSFILFLKTCLLINYSQPWCIWTRTCVSKCPRDRERAHTMYFSLDRPGKSDALALKRGQSRRGGGRRWRGPEMRWHCSWKVEMWQYWPWKTKCCGVVKSALHSGLKCVRQKKRT